MRHNASRLGCLTTLGLASLLTPGHATAQVERGVLRMGPWTGSVQADYEADQARSVSAQNPSTDYSLRHARETLTIRNTGFSLVDEAVLSGNLSLTIGRFQDRQVADGLASSSHGSVTGYGFDSILLGTSPYAVSLYANKVQNFIGQNFGRTEVNYQDEGAIFRFGETSFLRDRGMAYFSSSLRLDRQRVQETTTNVLGQSFRLDEVRKRLAYDGHNGFETADLDWNYSVGDVEDPVNPRNNSRTQAAGVNYSLDFGAARNRRWDSRLSYYQRSGTAQYESSIINEGLHVDHRSDLATDTTYFFNRLYTPAFTTTTQNGGVSLTYRPNVNITSIGQFSADHTRLPTGTIDTTTERLQLEYRRGLADRGTVSARLSGSEQQHDNRLTSSEVNITDEAHGAPAQLGAGVGFRINNAFVVPASIVVVDTRGGARLATVLGVDYDVVAEGNFTRIVPLLTSTVIQPADPLAVSYAYQLDPSLRYRSRSGSVSFGLDFGWISVGIAHDETSQEVLAGQDSQFLDEYHSNAASVDLRGVWRNVQAQGGGGVVDYVSTRLAYIQRRLYQLAVYRPVQSTSISVASNWTVTSYSLPSRRSETDSVRVSLDRYVPGGWTTAGSVGRRVYKESAQPTETVDEATLIERLTYGQLGVAATGTAGRQSRGEFRTTSWRVQISVTRGF
jgi:hypothetical protein